MSQLLNEKQNNFSLNLVAVWSTRSNISNKYSNVRQKSSDLIKPRCELCHN